MKMTIRKIAELAGVSRSAVDKVIHGRAGVRPEIRERVRQIIVETGYVPIHERKAAEPEAKREQTIGIIIPSLSNPYFRSLKCGMDSLAAAMPDLHLEYRYCEASNADGILSAVEQLERLDIALYLIRGIRSDRLRDKLNAMEKPVIFIDSVVPEADRLCFIGEDCYQSGRIAASLLAKTVQPNGKIAVIGGSPHVSGHKLRVEGFMDAIRSRFPGMQVVEQIYSQDQGVIAYKKACTLLDQHPDLCGICNLAGHAGEVGQAILDRHRQSSVKLVCYNITRDIAALIEKGVVEFSINIAPYRQGRLCIEVASQYLFNGIKPPKKFIQTQVSVVLDENMTALLEEDLEP